MGPELEVEMREPATPLTMSVGQLRHGCDGVWVSPVETIRKAKRKLILEGREGLDCGRGQMNSVSARPPTIPPWVTAISGALSFLGIAGLLLTSVLGFETPNSALL